MDFNFQAIEEKWKQKWKSTELYKVENTSAKPKFYVLDMFPYPSGAGLHVGHPLGYIASDIFSRYKRMKGFNVLHPMGFDAFGLPAEEYAIATGVHPAKSTADNIERYKAQLDNIGFCYDWSREIRTCEPSYYKWTQWIFTLLFNHYYDLKEDKSKSIASLITQFETTGTSNLTAYCTEEVGFSVEDWSRYNAQEKEEQLSKFRLAYRKIGYVNWCSALGTVLANDQIKEGLSERGGHPVERRAMTQWYLRTTAYAERLLGGLDNIDWSNALKTIQSNWIGKSKGAKVFFDIVGHSEKIEVFTTRPDTIFGATYMVLAPEHPLVSQLVTDKEKASIDNYLEYVRTRSERDRVAKVKEVTGAFTGSYALNPFSKKEIPIWIGEYVLMDYGTGAIMAVPSDDERDHSFAEKFGLEIVQVVDKSAYPKAEKSDKVGQMINSDFLDGLEVPAAIEKISQKITELGIGEIKTNYKMRDANFSRQRYWGEPFPITYKDGLPQASSLDKLPITLPHTEEFKPSSEGQSPLSKIETWVNLDDGSTRETDTMPAVAGSSWYFLRYMDPNNETVFAAKENLDYWQDVDLYVGGAEHAVAHLLYARFWHKFLFDLGYLPTEEPFKKLINQGMIQGVIEFLPLKKMPDDKNVFISYDLIDTTSNEDIAFIPVHIDFVSDYGSSDSHLNAEGLLSFKNWRPEYKEALIKTKEGAFPLDSIKESDQIVFRTKSEVGKMSKRYYNVVNPDKVVAEYGADTFRMYEMFLGPIEQSKPWDTQGIEGVSKFIRKFWGMFFDGDNFFVSEEAPSSEELKVLHKTIKKVSEDIEKFSFNTAISALMICVNELRKLNCNKRQILEPLIKLIAPLAPFTCEELWSFCGHESYVLNADYPLFDNSLLVENDFEYPICINGKKRMLKKYSLDLAKDELEKEALALEGIQKWVEGKNVVKVIVVPKRMINIVVK